MTKTLTQKMAVAARGKDADELSLLARDEDVGVRVEVAGNTSIPIKVQEILAKDASEAVRIALAKNYATGLKAVQILSADVSAEVRFAVTRHDNITELGLRRLSKDIDPDVRMAASVRLRGAEDILAMVYGEADIVLN